MNEPKIKRLLKAKEILQREVAEIKEFLADDLKVALDTALSFIDRRVASLKPVDITPEAPVVD